MDVFLTLLAELSLVSRVAEALTRLLVAVVGTRGHAARAEQLCDQRLACNCETAGYKVMNSYDKVTRIAQAPVCPRASLGVRVRVCVCVSVCLCTCVWRARVHILSLFGS